VKKTTTASPNQRNLEILRGRDDQDGRDGLPGPRGIVGPPGPEETQEFLALKETSQAE